MEENSVDHSTSDVEQFSARVLLVDDDPAVLEFMCDMLNSRGLEVISASTAEQALGLYGDDPGIDLIITDLTLPKMSGLDFASLVSAQNESLPIILYTGYDENVPPQAIEKAGINRFMYKPVNIDILTGEIKKLLAT